MIPQRYPGRTTDFGKPIDWIDELDGRCGVLPVEVVDDVRVGRVCQSYWKPTAAELATLNAGGVIRLGIYGGQPPVFIEAIFAPQPDGEPAPL